MSYRKATVADIDKNITQFFTDNQGRIPATEQPTRGNIENYYVLSTLGDNYNNTEVSSRGGSRRRRRPSRKYKKSAKRVFRKKSRSTRRR